MYEHFKEAEPGFIGGLVIPPNAKGVGSIYGKTREALIGWADDIWGLNLVGRAVRVIF